MIAPNVLTTEARAHRDKTNGCSFLCLTCLLVQRSIARHFLMPRKQGEEREREQTEEKELKGKAYVGQTKR